MKLFKKSLALFLTFTLMLLTIFPFLSFAEERDSTLHYVALGDSLAYGIAYDNSMITSYPALIELGVESETAYEVTLNNFGTPGYTTQNLLTQLTNDNTKQALTGADIITIDIGANDLLSAVYSDILTLDPTKPEQVAELKANAEQAINQMGINLGTILQEINAINPNAEIYVMGYYNALPHLQNLQPVIVPLMQALNGAIQGAAVAAGETFVPTFAAFEGNYDEYLPNPSNIHPNQQGYQAIAEVFLATIIPNLPPIEENPEEPIGPDEPAKEMERLFGHSRYDTAIAVSQKGWADDSVDKVIIARGDDFSDALAGAPLAYAWDTPILLTPSDRMLDSTLAEIERLGAEQIYVLGGDIAVSAKAEQTLKDEGYSVSRIEGHSRYDTAIEIANKLTGGASNQVVIANSHKFPDALTIGSFAAQAGVPILLTQDSKIPAATAEAITDLGVLQSIVVGGKLVVSEKVEAQLPNALRLSGHDRYDTNIAILEAFGANVDSLYIATGTEYADALTGGVLAAKEGKALILVRDIVPENVHTYLTDKNLENLKIFGGPMAVSDSVKEALEAILNP